MTSFPEAFALLILENTTLTFTGGGSESGNLALECVTLAHPDALNNNERDVYLVLRINTTETPLDPSRIVQRSDKPGTRTYTFNGTEIDPSEFILTFRLPTPEKSNPAYLEDLDTFESILAQYTAELRGTAHTSTPNSAVPLGSGPSASETKGKSKGGEDLRGHLVMIDETTGEIVGEVEDRFRIKEDPAMHEKGHENDPVIIEVSEESIRASDTNALEAFAHIVPPDQQDWITKSATVVSHAISMTTNLLLTTITTASSYYISHSTPSPHHSGATTPKGSPNLSAPQPHPPRALVFLTSEKTRRGLSKVHAVTGEAVKVSSKTVGIIDNMIRLAMGAKPKRARTAFVPSPAAVAPPSTSSSNYLVPTKGAAPPLPSRSPSPSQSWKSLAPPPYVGNPGGPPRRPTSPILPLVPSRDNVKPLSTKDRVLISADLILSTIDDSTRRVFSVGSEQLGKVMQHKYGQEAAQSSLLMAGTATNVGLVYVDMRGIGRRALLKRAGRTFVKARFSSGGRTPDSSSPQMAKNSVPR